MPQPIILAAILEVGILVYCIHVVSRSPVRKPASELQLVRKSSQSHVGGADLRAEVVVVVVVVKLLDVPGDEPRLLNPSDMQESAADTGFLS